MFGHISPDILNEVVVLLNFPYLPNKFSVKDLKIIGISEKQARKVCERLLKKGILIKHVETKGAVKKYIFEKKNNGNNNVYDNFIKDLTLPVIIK